MPKKNKRRGQLIEVAGKKNTWVIRVLTDYNPATGKRKYHNQTVHGTKKEAELVLTDILSKVDRNEYSTPSKSTLSEFLDVWLRDKKGSVRVNTLEGYEEKIRNYIRPMLGDQRLDKLTPLHVSEFYSKMRERGLSARTIKLTSTVLVSALDFAVTVGGIPFNPAKKLPKRHLASGVRLAGKSMDQEEAHRFMAAALSGDRWDLALAFALATGMRPSEYLGLRWTDLKLDDGIATVSRSMVGVKGGWRFEEPKTPNSRRSVPIPPTLIPYLKQRRKEFLRERVAAGEAWRDYDLVFCTPLGTPTSVANLTKRHFKPLRTAARVRSDLRLYDLRHTYATLMLKGRFNVKVVSQRLGHKDVAMTLRTYAHVLPETDEQATAYLDTLLFEQAQNTSTGP